MRLAAAGLLLLMMASAAGAQYCDFGEDSVYVIISGDTVNIWDAGVCTFCSSRYEMTVQIFADSIVVVETDTVVEKTLCTCVYDLKAGVSGLAGGSYRAIIYRQLLEKYGYPFDIVEEIGEIAFDYVPPASVTPHVETYQSACTPNAVGNEVPPLPRYFSLHQNHPNPFNPATAITYELPRQSYVTLKVFDILGRDVGTLVEENQEPGQKRVYFDAHNLPSGVYTYTLTAGTYRETRKMLLIR